MFAKNFTINPPSLKIFCIVIFLLSVTMVGVGLIGEYMGRTYQVVRGRARYHVSHVLDTKA